MKLRDCGPNLTEQDMLRLERELNFSLPRAYREFLLEHNGGRFYEPAWFTVDVPDYTSGLGSFRFFGYFDNPGNASWGEIREMVEVYQGRIAHGYIPFADTGNDVLLIGSYDEMAPLWLWVRDDEMSLSPAENLRPVADSLAKFWSGIELFKDGLTNVQRIPAFQAIEQYDTVRLAEYLRAGGDCNAMNGTGATLLHCACNELNYEAAELLIGSGADLDRPDRKWKIPPLYLATAKGARDLTDLLLRSGANLHMPGDHSKLILDAMSERPKPRMIAVWEKYVKITPEN